MNRYSNVIQYCTRIFYPGGGESFDPRFCRHHNHHIHTSFNDRNELQQKVQFLIINSIYTSTHDSYSTLHFNSFFSSPSSPFSTLPRFQNYRISSCPWSISPIPRPTLLGGLELPPAAEMLLACWLPALILPESRI